MRAHCSVSSTVTVPTTTVYYSECSGAGRKRFLLWADSSENKARLSPFGTGPSDHPFYRRSKFQMRDPQLFGAGNYDLEITVNPGECLFLPTFWWHYTESLDNQTITTRVRLTEYSADADTTISSGAPKETKQAKQTGPKEISTDPADWQTRVLPLGAVP